MGAFVAGVHYSFAPSSIQPIDGTITFSESPLRRLSTPHDAALILTLEVRCHLMRRILIDHGSAANLYLLALLRLGYKPDNLCNLGRVLVGFNGTQTTSLGEIVLPIAVLVLFIVIDEPSSFNAILGCTWIHAMKALPSSYHQILSFLTPVGQIDIRGDQKATKACYLVKQQQNDMPSKQQ